MDRLLRLHRDRPGGRAPDLQDQEELLVPSGNEELPPQLLSVIRDCTGRLHLLLPGHRQGLEGAEHQVPLVAAGSPLLPPHPVLRRGQEAHHEETSFPTRIVFISFEPCYLLGDETYLNIRVKFSFFLL